jgi:hypothetical protein
MTDCRNDCLDPLTFPRQPNNLPALSRIRYRIGTYAEIREALQRNLDKSQVLSGWTHRGSDDPGIALLEGAAILGDILTFYQELYANEAYLRTAQWRESIADLVRLLGYRLSPGLGGTAQFAIEVKGTTPVTVPAQLPIKAQLEDHDKPSEFETTEEITAYPWLNKFNLYRPLFTPYVDGNKKEFYIFAPDQFVTPVELKVGDRLVLGEADNPANPRVLAKAEIVVIDSVRDLHGTKLYKIKGGLKRTTPIFELTAFKLGRTFHHFGIDGARKITKRPASVETTATSKTEGSPAVTTTTSTTPSFPEYNHSFVRNWTNDTFTNEVPFTNLLGVSNSIKIVEPTLTRFEIPLDSEVNDLPAKSRLLIEMPLYKNSSSPKLDFSLVRTVESIRSGSQTFGLVTGTISIVTLDQQMNVIVSGQDYHITDARQMLLQELLSQPLQLRAAMQETSTATGTDLYFLGTNPEAQNLNGRPLLLTKSGSDPVSTLVNEVQAPVAGFEARPLLRRVTLDRTVTYSDFPNTNPITTVYGNLVDATEGKSEAPVPLGNGDHRLVFQTFKIPKAPLTYLISENSTPPEVPELEIYVNNRLWKRASSFFGREPTEEIYLVREDADDNSWVQFGDGKTGARLPSGIKNVVAKFRYGNGAFGPLKVDTKAQAGAKVDRLDKVQMPGVAAGGSEPETGENARQAAPGKIQSLDRLVSLKDFENEALGIAGVVKVEAAWDLVDNIPAVVLYILMDTGREGELAAVRETLANYNVGRGPNRFPICVPQTPSQRKYVVVNATYAYDSTFLREEIEQGIKLALGVSSGKTGAADDQTGLFSLYQRRFGQREYATSIAGTIQGVRGVMWAQVTRFESLGPLTDPKTFTPPTTPVNVQQAVECESQNVLCLYVGHLQLVGVAETVREGS